MNAVDSLQSGPHTLDTDPDHYRVVIACGEGETEQMIKERIKKSPSDWAIVVDIKRNTIGLGGIAHKDIQAHPLLEVERQNYFAGVVSIDPVGKTAEITVFLDRRDPRSVVKDRKTGEKHETGISVSERIEYEAFKDAIAIAIQEQLLQRL